MNNYKLLFFKKDVPPVLFNGAPDGFGKKIYVVDNYVIGSIYNLDSNFNVTNSPNPKYIKDPNWMIYPRSEFLTARDKYPITYAFTNYEIDSNHYLFYIPKDDLSKIYSILLRDHFDNIRTKNKQISISETKEKLKNLEKYKKNQATEIKEVKNELEKLKKIKDREIRYLKRKYTLKESEDMWNTKNPNYNKFNTTLNILKQNLKIINLEINNLKKEIN